MFRFIFRILYALTTLIETVIVFRIVLKVINANMDNNIVTWIMKTSDLLIYPFKDVVAQRVLIDKFDLELTPLVALLFYAIIAFVLSELSKSFNRSE